MKERKRACLPGGQSAPLSTSLIKPETSWTPPPGLLVQFTSSVLCSLPSIPSSHLHSQYICWGPKSQLQRPNHLKASAHHCQVFRAPLGHPHPSCVAQLRYPLFSWSPGLTGSVCLPALPCPGQTDTQEGRPWGLCLHVCSVQHGGWGRAGSRGGARLNE